MSDLDLMRMKRKVDDSKEEYTELKGKEKALLEQLEERWDCRDVEEANSRLKAMNNERDDLERDLERDTKKLSDKFREIEDAR